MGAIESHRDLIVWQKSMRLAVEVYHLSASFPQVERYRLSDQITRAVASVPANIAEGYSRDSTGDYARFLAIAKGSLMEVETFIQLAVHLSYLTSDSARTATTLIVEISKMLTSLRAKILAQAGTSSEKK